MKVMKLGRKPTSGIRVKVKGENHKPCSFYLIDIESNEVILEEDLGECTPNVADAIGVITAISYCIDNNIKNVYTSSATALFWLRKKEISSGFDLKNNETLLSRIVDCYSILESLEVETDRYVNSIINKDIRVTFCELKLWKP